MRGWCKCWEVRRLLKWGGCALGRLWGGRVCGSGVGVCSLRMGVSIAVSEWHAKKMVSPVVLLEWERLTETTEASLTESLDKLPTSISRVIQKLVFDLMQR